MSAYYNEFDAGAAAWLRELIRRGLIADGEVDERSILDVSADDLFGFTQCHFFAGIGGWSLALRMAGWPDDVPVWTGSPPCQPFSAAGQQKGKDDERHLAPHFATLVAAGRPRFLFGEQVASAAVFGAATKRAGGAPDGKSGWAWIDDLFGRLEAAHYACGASDIPAAGIGAPHIRQRTFFGAVRLADAASGGHQPRQGIARICGSDFGENASTEQRGAVCSIGRLADADQAGRGGQRQDDHGGAEVENGSPRRGSPHIPGRGAAGGLVHGQQPRLEGQSGHGDDRHEPGRVGADAARPVAEAGGSRSVDDRGRPGADHGGWGSADWLFCRDGKWRPVEARPQPLVDGLPEGMGRVRDPRAPLTEEGLKSYAEAAQTRPEEVLRNLCIALAEKAQLERQAGGYGDVSEAALLLAFVCQLAAQGWQLAQHLPLSRPQEPPRGMRMLWDHEAVAGASRQRGLDGQLAGEPADLVHLLSPLLARDAHQAWGEAIAADAEIGFPLGTGSPARVGRLRGYGNAIVPQVAAEFVTAFMQALSRADI